jgi:hypothetical protein
MDPVRGKLKGMFIGRFPQWGATLDCRFTATRIDESYQDAIGSCIVD